MLTAAPLVIGLSMEKHRFTFGDSGKLNYGYHIGTLPKYFRLDRTGSKGRHTAAPSPQGERQGVAAGLFGGQSLRHAARLERPLLLVGRRERCVSMRDASLPSPNSQNEPPTEYSPPAAMFTEQKPPCAA